jgi:phosphohistidine phosphatase
MGKLLKKTNVKTDLIISSPAKRAFATAEKIAAEINYDKRKIETDNDIYLATSKELSDFTSRLNNKFNDVMIFGHNPGLTDFLNHLCTENITNMPTGSVACIEFQIDDWSEIKTHKGKLKFFEYPKKNF